MQHPDEGMIHSWLDGALSAEDSAAVESHVVGCQQCATVVAEARGFIAASSRILTALDDVPRGVIPAAPARKRDLRVVWRVAAAMLVVAGGSFVALRDGGQETAVRLSTTDSVASLESNTSDAAPSSAVVEGAGIAEDATAPRQQSKVLAPSNRRAAPARTNADLAKATGGRAPTTERDFSGNAAGKTGGVVVGGTGPTIAATAAPAAGTLASVSEFRARAEAAPLKVLSVERVIGGSRTTYQIGPTQTVALTETVPLRLSEVVTTGAAARTARGARAVAPMSAQAAAAPPPAPPVSDSLRRRDSAASATEAATTAGKTMQQLRVAPSVALQPNTISWLEAATGKNLTLSGNLPVERLQEIKLSIERERAATRAKAP